MKRRYMSAILAGCAVAVAIALVACEDKGSEEEAAPQNTGLGGRWYVRGGNWDRRMDLTQDGDSVNGIVTNERNGDTQTVRGTISGTGITLYSGDVTGTGAISGQSMRGDYSRPNGDTGKWRAWR